MIGVVPDVVVVAVEVVVVVVVGVRVVVLDVGGFVVRVVVDPVRSPIRVAQGEEGLFMRIILVSSSGAGLMLSRQK